MQAELVFLLAVQLGGRGEFVPLAEEEEVVADVGGQRVAGDQHQVGAGQLGAVFLQLAQFLLVERAELLEEHDEVQFGAPGGGGVVRHRPLADGIGGLRAHQPPERLPSGVQQALVGVELRVELGGLFAEMGVQERDRILPVAAERPFVEARLGQPAQAVLKQDVEVARPFVHALAQHHPVMCPGAAATQMENSVQSRQAQPPAAEIADSAGDWTFPGRA